MPILSHVNLVIPANGEPAAREFYARLLGLTEVPKPEPLRARGGVWFEAGPAQIHLSVGRRRSTDPEPQAHVGLVFDDIDAVAGRLRAAGVATEPGRPGPWKRFFVYDPFGNRLEIHEPGGMG
ncbi:MAG: VOC family protein [Thermoplasmatota archaeon]